MIAHRRLGARSVLIGVIIVLFAGAATPAEAAPEGQLTWGVHFSLAPTWLDPVDTPAMVTRSSRSTRCTTPMPGNPMAPSLAEAWTVSKDGPVN